MLYRSIVSSLLRPLLWFDFILLTVAIVWLGMISQLRVMGICLVAVFFAQYIIPIFLLPAGIFSHFMALFQRAGNVKKERYMFVCSLGYILLFMTLWSTGIFTFIMRDLLPVGLHLALMLASSVALAPLLLWAMQDRENIFIISIVELLHVAMLILSLIWLFKAPTSFGQSFMVVASILLIFSVIQAFYEKKKLQKK